MEKLLPKLWQQVSIMDLYDADRIMDNVFGREPKGRVIGRFVVLKSLGQGGMGKVLEAYDPQLDRKVALKLVRRPFSRYTNQLKEEAQRLAKFEHPNVVSVYDVGEHDGEVFIAMELVEGQTLLQWQQNHRFWREILDVYIQAGRGLDQAHTQKLIHRDFKPSNCVLGQDGRVRVLDFGLAREDQPIGRGTDELPQESGAASGRSTRTTGTSTTTHDGKPTRSRLAGTEGYIAPERLLGRRASASSDQYSYCVALFEALYGRHPNLPEPEPEPSGPLSRRVPGWLRGVVVRGLSDNPEERWPDMQTLLARLERGRRRSWLRKGAFVVVGVGGLILGSWWSRGESVGPCDDVRAAIQKSRERVWSDDRQLRVQESLMAQRVSYASETWERVQGQIDGYLDNWSEVQVDACEAVWVRHERSQAALVLQQSCLHDGYRRLGHAIERLEYADELTVKDAVKLVTRLPSLEACMDAEALARRSRPVEASDELLDTLRDKLSRARSYQLTGHFDTALPLVVSVLEDTEDLPATGLAAGALQLRGQLELDLGRNELAAEYLEKAVEEGMRYDQVDVTLEALSGWIHVLAIGQERLGAAQGLEPVADALISRHDEPLQAADVYISIAQAWAHFEDFGAARVRYRQALEKIGELDSIAKARALDGLAQLARQEDDEGAALDLFQESLSVRESLLGSRHPDTVFARVELCGALSQLRPDEALEFCQRALEFLAEDSSDPGRIAHVYNSMASAYRAQGNIEQSEVALLRALEGWTQAYGPEHIFVAKVHFNLGRILEQQDRSSEAAAAYRAALRSAGAKSSTSRGTIRYTSLAVKCHRQLGLISAEKRELDRAIEHYETGLAMLDPKLESHQRLKANLLNRHGEALRELGDAERASNEHREALEIYQRFEGTDAKVAVTKLRLAQSLAVLERWQRTERLLEEAIPRLSAGSQELTDARSLLTDIRSHRR